MMTSHDFTPKEGRNRIGSDHSAPRKRRWHQFSLRTLLVFIVLLSVLLGVFSVWRERGRRQARNVATIRKHGGNVTYDYMSRQNSDGSVSYGRKAESPIPAGLIRWLGVDCFHEVVSINADSGSRQSVWDAIGECPEVTKLSVSGSSDQAPTDVSPLSNLRRLRSLAISGAIRNEDLQFIQEAVDLEWLSIRDNTFSDQGLRYLAALPKLEEVHLPFTHVGDAGLKVLAECPNLKVVNLSHTKVTDAGVEHLAAIPNLTFLSLEATNVTDAGAVKLRRAKELKTLHLRRTKVSDKGLKGLEELNHLQALYLEGTYVTGQGIRWPKSILYLDLRHTRLSDSGLMSFDSAHRLRISVYGTTISDSALQKIARERPGIVLDYSQ